MTKQITYFKSIRTQRPWRFVVENPLHKRPREFCSSFDKSLQQNKSRNLRGHALSEYKKTIKLNPMQKEVLIGTLLGDACLYLQYGKPKLSVKFEQNIIRAG